MSLNPEEYHELRALFEQAIEMRPEEQRAFLEAHPLAAPFLTALLAEDANQNTLLDRGSAGLASQLMSEPDIQMCGPYRLEEVIGEGGSGIVYRGRRDDLNSTAAIKILRDAWISPERRLRFEREQRTLARLQHPGIATLLDAGITSEGTPWIAMEFVDGVPLNRYADEHGLSVNQRLQLFMSVCSAVQYAHERAIIHRDLKPSNILIVISGRPRLLDFGIARPLDEVGIDVTRPELRMLTPAYAAPEQQRGEPAGVYTDVYGLGVILYELLAHRLPADNTPPSSSPDRAHGDAAWDDIDVLCGRAMHSDPEQRYRSVDALSGDIRRYLAFEPLEARPDSATYKIRKFVTRHRTAVLMTTTFIVVLGVLAGWFTWKLNSSKNEALAAAARAQRIQSFLMSLFEGGDAAAGPTRGLTVETLIDRGVREAGALDREPGVQGEVYETLGRMYGKLGRYSAAEKTLTAAVQRGTGTTAGISSLTELAMVKAEQGEFDSAERLANQAIDTSTRMLGGTHELTLAAEEALGRILTEHGRYSEAIEILQKSLALRESKNQPASLAVTAAALSAAHFYAGRFDESRLLSLRALAARKKAHGEKHPLVADDWLSVGAIEFDTGRYKEAEQYYRLALAVKQAWYGPDHPETASAQTMLGRALVYQKRNGEARTLLEKALSTQTRIFGEEHTRVASTLNDLGNIFVTEQKWAEAEQCYRRMEEAYRASRGDAHYLVATALSNRANVYLRQGRAAQAEKMLRNVVARYTRALSPEHVNTAIARIRLGRSLVRQSLWREAVIETRAGYDILLRQAKAPVSWLQGAREDLATAYAALGEQTEADRFQKELSAPAN